MSFFLRVFDIPPPSLTPSLDDCMYYHPPASTLKASQMPYKLLISRWPVLILHTDTDTRSFYFANIYLIWQVLPPKNLPFGTFFPTHSFSPMAYGGHGLTADTDSRPLEASEGVALLVKSP